jgi:DNA-binding SARP family transcriptional activator
VDVDEFNTLLAKARVIASEEEAAHCYAKAVALYRGEFLQNLYYDWLFPERRRLEEGYLKALKGLAEFNLLAGDTQLALEYLKSAIQLDPLCEELYCQVMQACSTLGKRSEMVRFYHELQGVLADELNMQPQKETTRLYKSLLERSELKKI